MTRSDANAAANENKISGYFHHPYELEKLLIHAFQNGDRRVLQHKLDLSLYSDVLAPQPFRAMQNSAICMVTIVCRATIDYGVEIEKSFSISDYYIHKIEEQTDKRGLETLVMEMMNQYMDEIQNKQEGAHSLHVMRSIRYIHQHLYEPCRVGAVANAVSLHPAYLSALFKAEMGITISRYIRDMKLEEAKNLLQYTDYAVHEIAEMLGFCDCAHFSNQFKVKFGQSPKRYIK